MRSRRTCARRALGVLLGWWIGWSLVSYAQAQSQDGAAGHRIEIEVGAGAASYARHRQSQLLGLIGDGDSDVLRVRSGLLALSYRAQRHEGRGLHAHLEGGFGAGLMVARRADGGHFDLGFNSDKGRTGTVHTYGAGAGVFFGPWGRFVIEPGLHLALAYGDTCASLQPEGASIKAERICLATPIVSLGARAAVSVALGQGGRHALRIVIDAAPITSDGHRLLGLSLRWSVRLFERARTPPDPWMVDSSATAKARM